MDISEGQLFREKETAVLEENRKKKEQVLLVSFELNFE
jgi:hypothetical protein